MEAVEAIFTQFKALIDADSGAGGLRNSTGNQYVRGGVFRETNVQAKTDAPRNWPTLIVGISGRETGHEASGRCFEGLIRASVETDRDKGVAEQDAILGRLVDVTNGIALASGSTGWAFSTLTYLRPIQQIGGKEIGPLAEFQVIATK